MALHLLAVGAYMLISAGIEEYNRRQERPSLEAYPSYSTWRPGDPQLVLLELKDEIYQKFPVGPDEVRSLAIEAGTGEIYCTVFTKPLSEDHEYYALSYTWGQRTENRHVFVHGIKFKVTDNLYDALHQFRAGAGGKTRLD
jgi:hypothetical protein